MNFKTFIKKLKTNVPFRKKVLLIGGSSLVLILAVVFVVKGTNMSAAVMNIPRQNIARQVDTCTDTDGGKNHEIFGRIYTVINGYAREEADSCNNNGTLREWFCGNPGEAAGLLRSENYVDCTQGCNNGACRNCNNPEGILACSLGLNTCDALCMQGTGTSGYGYGYGYSRTGGTYGYGYGYGYKKIDPKTNKPWMYLLIPFKTYTKAIYDSVVSKLGFQMVKSYNKKEFKAPTTK